MEKESNWIENKEINFKEDEKFKLDANMIIAIGVFIIAISFAFNAMNAQEQIKKSFESLRDYK